MMTKTMAAVLSSSPARLALCLGLMTIISACGLPEERPPYIDKKDKGVPTHDGAPPLEKPTLNRLKSTVCVDTIPLQGTAQPGVDVIISGGQLGSSVYVVADLRSGQFCKDVPLKKNELNIFEARVIDSEQGTSEPATAQTTHEDTCEDNPDDPDPEPKNIALGLIPKSSKAPKLHKASNLTDGDPTTYTVYEDYDWGNYSVWLTFGLEQVTPLEQVVIHWRDYQGSGTDFGTNYKVLVSTFSDPGDPQPEASSGTEDKWTTVGDVSNGDGCRGGTCGMDVFELAQLELQVRHVALWLIYDDDTGFAETFAIGEIEIFETPESNPTTSKQPTCATMGN